MSDFAAKMTTARTAERTFEVCLRGDLRAELEDLVRRAAAEQRTSGSRSKEDTTAVDLVQEIQRLQEEMHEATEVFRFRALPPRKYRALREAHPPRRDDKGDIDLGDMSAGFNRDSMLPVLVRACTVSPVLTDEQWHELLGDTEARAAELEAEGRADEVNEGLLTFGQSAAMVNSVYNLNEGDVSVPFSSSVLPPNRSSDSE